jgi:F-type H+-transporting ATPase subunit b
MRKNLVPIALAVLQLLIFSGLAFASAEGHHADSGVLLKDFLYRIFNFAIVVGLLAYFLAKPIKKGMAGRREDIEKALTEAKQMKEAAEAKFAEYDRKLTQATDEITEITESIRREGEAEKQNIINNAKEMALKVEQEAEKTAELEVAKARAELQREAVQLAVGLAEGLLKNNFTKEDDARLIEEYLQKVGELH